MGCLKLKYHPKTFSTFGSEMETRSFSSVAYKYGFNGKEKDDETYGEGNAYDFGARIYDGRLGRWFSNDPLTRKYPYLSPYSFCYDNPIIFMDFDGKDFIIVVDKANGTITISATYYVDNEETRVLTQKAVDEIMGANGEFIFATDERDYDIIYDLDVINVKEKDPETDALSEAEKDKTGNSVKEFSSEDFKVQVPIASKTDYEVKNETISVLVFGKHIMTRKRENIDENTRVHYIKTEILHTLGAEWNTNLSPFMSTMISKKRIRLTILTAMSYYHNEKIQIFKYEKPSSPRQALFPHEAKGYIQINPDDGIVIKGKVKKKRKKKEKKKMELSPRYLNRDPNLPY